MATPPVFSFVKNSLDANTKENNKATVNIK